MEGSASRQGFLPRLEATFLSIFHPLDGPKVLFQMPEDAFYEKGQPLPLLPTRQRQSLMLDFDALSDYVIPKAPLCGRLITCNVLSHASASLDRKSYKVVGYPVLLEEAGKYERNHFIFNLCFVFEAQMEVRAYEPIVRKCARVLRSLEEESSFVSRLDNLPRLYGIVEQLYEDLNAYYEAFIALPEGPDDEPDMTQRSPKPTSRNLTLVSSEELDALIAQASGPLSRVREEKLGVRRRGLDRASSLRSLHSLASSTQSLPTDSKAQSADITNVRRSSTIASERLVEEASRRPRASSPPPPPPMPHGLGQTVRDAINLKLIPTFPNPPVVKDWDVPVLLVDLGKHANDGWDLTLTKLIPFLDGVNHVKRISQISDTDILLVRQCIEHLLYYSFAIVIDIFQFSNIYAVCPQIARMLDEPGIGEECANYIAKPGQQPLATPMLWRLYSMLRQGRTLHDWCVMAGHYASVVDIRRFITFGVIKGFVRRVYRYPVFLNHGGLSGSLGHYADVQERHGASDASILPAASPGALGRSSVFSSMMFGLSHINASTADNPHEADAGMGMPGAARTKEPRSVWRRNTRPFLRRPTATAIDVASVAHGTDQYRDEPDREGTRPARSPAPRSSPAPPELAGMLDGTRTDDELCVHFNVSWPRLYQMMLQLTQPHLLRMNTDEMSPDRRRMSDHAGTSNPGFVSSLSGASLFVYGDFESRENLRQHDSPERSPARAGLIAVVSV